MEKKLEASILGKLGVYSTSRWSLNHQHGQRQLPSCCYGFRTCKHHCYVDRVFSCSTLSGQTCLRGAARTYPLCNVFAEYWGELGSPLRILCGFLRNVYNRSFVFCCIWADVKIMVPLWIPSTIRHLISRVPWVLPPLSNSWIITIIWLYIALNRTPNMDCSGVQSPKGSKKGTIILTTTHILMVRLCSDPGGSPSSYLPRGLQ